MLAWSIEDVRRLVGCHSLKSATGRMLLDRRTLLKSEIAIGLRDEPAASRRLLERRRVVLLVIAGASATGIAEET